MLTIATAVSTLFRFDCNVFRKNKIARRPTFFHIENCSGINKGIDERIGLITESIKVFVSLNQPITKSESWSFHFSTFTLSSYTYSGCVLNNLTIRPFLHNLLFSAPFIFEYSHSFSHVIVTFFFLPECTSHQSSTCEWVCGSHNSFPKRKDFLLFLLLLFPCRFTYPYLPRDKYTKRETWNDGTNGKYSPQLNEKE